MLWYGLKVNNQIDIACRDTKGSCYSILLSGFCMEQGHTATWKNHVAACLSAFSIFSPFGLFSSSFWSFCSSITYKIKITCKNSQYGAKQDKNTKYKRVKIYIIHPYQQPSLEVSFPSLLYSTNQKTLQHIIGKDKVTEDPLI